MSENVYTRQDLSIMQAWPLERKVMVTQAKILEWHRYFDGKIAVSYSGGKDSVVLLDLARRAFPDMPAVFVDTGLELPEIRNHVRATDNVAWLRPQMPFHEVIKKYGYPVVSKEVAHRIYYARQGRPWALMHLRGLMKDGTPSKFNERYKKWAFLVDAPFAVSGKCCDVTKKRPLHRFQKETGRALIVGTMASESIARQSAYLQTGCNSFHSGKSQPMSFWLEQDVLRYLRLTGIPYSNIYGDIVEEKGKLITTGAHRTGCAFCMFGVHLERQPNRFQRMEFSHPNLHDYCINKLGCGMVMDYIGAPYRGGEANGKGSGISRTG